MRRHALGAALIAACVLASNAHAGQWLTGSVTNPPANTVLLTTGTMSASSQPVEFVVFLRTTVAVQVAIERLTSSGQVVAKDSITFMLDSGPMTQLPLTVDFDSGDIFRVRVVGGVTGTVQGAIRFNSGYGYCVQGVGCAR